MFIFIYHHHRFFVTRSLLEIAPNRPRPVLICMARDVAGFAKKCILDALTRDLPGMFVHVNSDKNHGVDVEAIQRILSTGQSCIADVDVGLAADQRGAFLAAIQMAKRGLVPSPCTVLAMGDLRNRHGILGDEYLGVNEMDLRKTKDGALKRTLQVAAESVAALRSPNLYDQVKALSEERSPPSRAHALVLEAIVILLTPSNRFQGPSLAVSSMAWAACRLLLAEPVEFVQRLGETDPNGVPPQNLTVLKEYLANPEWPDSQQADFRDNLRSPCLARLVSWVECLASYAGELRRRGGPPKMVSKRSPPGLFAAVVPVADALSRYEENNELSARGWKAACVQLMAPTLEDMRVHREALKIQGVLHTVNVYRDCHRVFFSAYDPDTSLYRSCSINVSAINLLLAPNSIESSEFGAKGAPSTTEELYHRLVELLTLEKHKIRNAGQSAVRKQMVCRRRLTLLLRETRRVSGHLATVTVYEEAKGELRAHVYLPQFSAAIELAVSNRVLKSLYPHADEHWEQPHLASQDAMRLLNPIGDRLEVRPSLMEINDMGRVARPAPGKEPTTLAQLARHQGFKAILREKGGPGRLLFRRMAKVSGVNHIITCREYGRHGLLRLAASCGCASTSPSRPWSASCACRPVSAWRCSRRTRTTGARGTRP